MREYEMEAYSAKKAIAMRTFELILLNSFLSVILTILCSGMLISTNQKKCFVWSSFFVLIYFVANTFMLKKYCKKTETMLKYFACSYAAYTIFALITFTVYKFANKDFYTWFFSITKFAQFLPFDITTLGSIIIFHVLLCFSVIIAPINIMYIWDVDKYNQYSYDEYEGDEDVLGEEVLQEEFFGENSYND